MDSLGPLLGGNFSFTPNYFFQQSPTWIEIDKHNASDNVDTERVEEKLLHKER